MGWFRSRTKLGACLALFALALSLMLSFGHLHWGRSAGHTASDIHLALGHADHDHADHDHAGHDHANHGHDDADRDHDHGRLHSCFICTVAMAAPFAATAPDLPKHDAVTFRLTAAVAAFDLHEPLRTAFRSRAPPRA